MLWLESSLISIHDHMAVLLSFACRSGSSGLQKGHISINQSINQYKDMLHRKIDNRALER